MSEIQTSYYLVENGKPNGPYNMSQLSELKEQGRLTPDTYVWQEGMQNWAFAKNRTDLKSLFSEVLPPPIQTMSSTEPATEPTSDDGVFSARLEALINSALQDGVLTDQEKAILKKRTEAEGDDWDEVEMIINARLA